MRSSLLLLPAMCRTTEANPRRIGLPRPRLFQALRRQDCGYSEKGQSGALARDLDLLRKPTFHVAIFLTCPTRHRRPTLYRVFPRGHVWASVMSANHRIIVCDDQRDTAITLAQLLRSYGYEVFSCFEGEACLEKARAWAPYAAIVDIGLPGLTGYQLARALRALPKGENLLLIAVTAYGNPENVKEAQVAGFDWHFRKPAPPSSIIDVLRHPSSEAQEGTRLAQR